MPQHPAILHVEGGLDQGDIVRIQLGPDIIVGEEQDAVGVVYQTGDAVREEVGQNRHSHASVDIDAPEGHRPAGRVAGADGDFVPFLDFGFRQETPELLDIDGQVFIREGFSAKVTESVLFPMVTDRIL